MSKNEKTVYKKCVIGLLISNKKDNDFIKSLLTPLDYAIKNGISYFSENFDFNILICDDIFLKKYNKKLLSLKKKYSPLLLPIIIVTNNKKNKTSLMDMLVDDVIMHSKIESELISKINTLCLKKKQIEELWDVFFYENNDALLLLDDKLNIQMANKRAEKLYGYSLQEMNRLNLIDLRAPETQKILFKQMNQACLNLKGEWETIHVDKTGKKITVKITTKSIFTLGGYKFIHVVHNITALNQAEDLSSMLTSIIKYSDDAIISKTLEGVITSWNKGAEKIYGYTSKEMIGKNVSLLMPPERKSELLNILEKMKSGKRIKHYETKRQRKDGKIIDVSVTISPIKNFSGKVIGASAIARDITQRKQLEYELKLKEEGFERLAESMPQMVATAKPDGWVDYYNKLWYSYTGLSKKASEGWGWSKVIHPEDLPSCLQGWKDAIAARKPYEVKVRLKRKSDKTYRWHIARALPWINASGEVIRWFATCIDVHEMLNTNEKILELNRSLEARVNERTKELNLAYNELEAFSYSVSHDLQAPLRAIEGFSQILLKKCTSILDEDANKYLMRISLAAQQMSELINALLRLARFSTFSMSREKINLSKLVERIAKELLEQNPNRIVNLIVKKNIFVDADIHLLEVVIENLLDNAWKFTSKKSQAKIEFGTLIKDNQTIYFIRDNGVGLDMAYVDKLFNPFQRLHTADEFPGTGIGLATVKRIIQRHNGKIWVEGRKNKGTIFYFTL